MRQFNGYVFLGNGNASSTLTHLLKRRLVQAIEIVSDLQQPYHPSENEDPHDEEFYVDQCKAELVDIVKDIATALGVSVSRTQMAGQGSRPHRRINNTELLNDSELLNIEIEELEEHLEYLKMRKEERNA